MIGSLPAMRMINVLTASADMIERRGMRNWAVLRCIVNGGCSGDMNADLFFELMFRILFEYHFLRGEFVDNGTFVHAPDTS